MNNPTDDHLQEFRSRSDQAFLAMQVCADEAMSQFLNSYGDDTPMTSFQTPDFVSGQTPKLDLPGLGQASNSRRASQLAEAGKQSLKRAASRKSKGAQGISAGLGDLGDTVRQELNEQAAQITQEGKGFLRGLTADLGERAKREAAALAEAERKAMQEETSLRGLKARAQSELQAAKMRVAAELSDARTDAVEDLEGLAMGRIGALHEEGMEAAGSAGRSAQKKLDDILLS